MKIAVIGADTRLGKRIAKEAYHRGNAVTAVVRDPSLLDSVKYDVITDEAYDLDPAPFDRTVDVRTDEVRITGGGKTAVLVPPEELDPDGRRLGEYEITEAWGEYIGEEDFALAALDLLEQESDGTFYVRSRRAPALPEEPGGKRRYAVFPDRGIAGKVYRLELDDLGECVVHFLTDDTLLFAEKGRPFETLAQKARACDEGVWFVSFIREGACVTLVLDEPQRLVTMVSASMKPKRTQLSVHTYHFGAILMPNEQAPFVRHAFTDELVGQKITWHYSPYVNITHCYWSERFLRNSLRSMKPVPEDAPSEAKFDAEDRIRRWANIFFEEPAEYIKINSHLYLVSMREATRNRVDPLQGGGDMVFVINTRRMRYYGRGYNQGKGVPAFNLMSAYGDWDDEQDPMDTAVSPFRV